MKIAAPLLVLLASAGLAALALTTRRPEPREPVGTAARVDADAWFV